MNACIFTDEAVMIDKKRLMKRTKTNICIFTDEAV